MNLSQLIGLLRNIPRRLAAQGAAFCLPFVF
jgi:hypothetical protein